MAYVKQNFVDGNVLYASELNHIEDGIADAALSDLSNVTNATVAGKIGTGAITATKIAANAVSTLYTATLLANGWEDEGGSVPTYKQVLTINGLLTTDNAILDMNMVAQSGLSRAQQVAMNEAWKVVRAWTGSNSLTVRMSEPPEMDIPIQILCIRK